MDLRAFAILKAISIFPIRNWRRGCAGATGRFERDG
jgi:hypothetical protein